MAHAVTEQDFTENTTYWMSDISDTNSTGNASVFNMNTTESSPTVTPYRGSLGYGPIEQFVEFVVGYYISVYYLWVITVIGIPGNVLSIFTIVKMGPMTSSSLYIVVLAVADNLSIIFKLFFLQFTLYDVIIGPWGCKFIVYFASVWSMYANWVLVAMTAERFVAVWFPLQVNRFCTKKSSAVILATSLVVVAGLNGQFLHHVTDIYHPVHREHCSNHDWAKYFMRKYWYWIEGAFYTMIPCAIIITLNTLIVIGMMASRKNQNEMVSNKADQIQGRIKQQRQVTVMLLAISITFVVLTLPNAVFYAVRDYWDFQSSMATYSKYLLSSTCILVLSDSNHAVNFYLYFLGGKKFRVSFLRIVCRRARMSRSDKYVSARRVALSKPSNTSVSIISGGSSTGSP